MHVEMTSAAFTALWAAAWTVALGVAGWALAFPVRRSIGFKDKEDTAQAKALALIFGFVVIIVACSLAAAGGDEVVLAIYRGVTIAP